MGIYNVQIGGIGVRVRVIDDGELLSAALAELELEGGGNDGEQPIIGLDVKKCSNWFGRRRCALFILSTRTKSLIIQLDRMRRKEESSMHQLKNFLTNKHICFVCPNGFVKKVSGLSFEYKYERRGYEWLGIFNCEMIDAVEVGNYASRILKSPKLLKCKSIEKLGDEAGVDIAAGGNVKRPRWDSEVFSEEEVRCVMRDSVACYRIVHKLLHPI